MAKPLGFKSKHINSLKDDIIFSVSEHTRINNKIFLSMAGTTNPDPTYYIHRLPTDVYKHLYVLEYVISGKGYVESENHKYTVRAGDFYLLNRYTLPRYHSDPDDPFCKIWVNIDGRFMNALTYTHQINEPVMIVHDESLETYIRQIHAEIEKYPPEEISKSYDRIMTILFELFQKIGQLRENRPPEQSSVTFFQITEYISENIFLERLDVDYLCTYFYISYSTLYRICMNGAGLSPRHYILKLKIDQAKNMLSSTKCSVSKASETLNFSSSSYFTKVFRKYAGVTPLQWKKQENSESDEQLS